MEAISPTRLANFLQVCIDKKAFLNGKFIHAHILRAGLFADTFLLNRLIELYYKCGHVNAARQVFDVMPHKNVYSCNAILSAYCKSSRVADARELFVLMPERNAVSWNTLISALVRGGCEREALDLYHEMNSQGFLPTNFTLASVLSACGALVDVECGRVSHGFATKIGLDKNMYVGNALLGMYSKCGCTRDAVLAFKDLPEVNEVSFTVMMGALAETDQPEEAFNMFRSMHRMGIHIDAVSLSSILNVCAKSRKGELGVHNQVDGLFYKVHGQQIHGLTTKLGFERDLHLNNSLLDMYAKFGDMDSAEKIFDSLTEVSIVSWNVMISGYGQKYQIGKAIECMERMESCGFKADEVTYINMLAACTKSGDIETGRRVFDSMECPSLISWNALLSGYSQVGNHQEAIKLFRVMQFRSVKADRTTLAIILSSCSSMLLLEGGKQVHAALLKEEFHSDIYVASGLIGLYSKCNKMEAAKSVFDRSIEEDIVCWNSMMAGFSFNSLDKEALTLFREMLGKGLFASEFSYATALSSCAKLSYLSQGRQVHARTIKDDFANDVVVGSALINMYSKCGYVDEARIFFNMMPDKNTVTWNEMIHGYAQNGRGDEAVCLYEDMVRSGEKPDSITFVAVLTACSHSGLVEFGIRIFNSMRQEHEVEPTSDHYTCIIDCLGRAARFEEVKIVLDKMPCKDDSIVWEVLLSACRVHGNVSLARRAADELFRLDPSNSAPYVLLANMYSSLERWDDVKTIREMMIRNKVVKDPGYSWLEHKNEGQGFTVDDNVRMVDELV